MVWNRKIVTVMMEYDYCDPKRGYSGEKIWFYENLKKLVSKVEPFWFDNYEPGSEKLQIALIDFVRLHRPDLIFFVPYTNQFKNSTLSQLKDINTAAWLGDDTWRFDSYSSKLAPYFKYAITTDRNRFVAYQNLGTQPIVSQWASNPPLTQTTVPTQTTFRYQVTFVGSRNEVRDWYVNRLKKQGIHVECFGSGWSNGRISPDQMEEIFRQSRINLNMSNSVPRDIQFIVNSPMNFARWLISKKRFEQIKARHFEIPMAGGFQLAHYALGLEDYWHIGQEIAIYSNPDECADQIRYFLNNEDVRADMTLKGWRRAQSDHTFEKRLKEVLQKIFDVPTTKLEKPNNTTTTLNA